jgi:hypothetical protein
MYLIAILQYLFGFLSGEELTAKKAADRRSRGRSPRKLPDWQRGSQLPCSGWANVDHVLPDNIGSPAWRVLLMSAPAKYVLRVLRQLFPAFFPPVLQPVKVATATAKSSSQRGEIVESFDSVALLRRDL